MSLKGWVYNRKWQFCKAVILLWALKLVKASKAHLVVRCSHLFDDEILKKRTLSELLGKIVSQDLSFINMYVGVYTNTCI